MRDGRGGLAGDLAGAFGHGPRHDAHFGGVGKSRSFARCSPVSVRHSRASQADRSFRN
jgi:hypothetical protein